MVMEYKKLKISQIRKRKADHMPTADHLSYTINTSPSGVFLYMEVVMKNNVPLEEVNLDMFGFKGVSLDDLDRLLPDEETKARWPEMMLTIYESLRDEFNNLNLDERYALIMLARLCKDTGGLQYYFPKGDQLEHQLKCMYIWRDFDGKNVPDLAIKYDTSTQNIYTAIRKMRALEVKKRQPPLF